MIAKEFSLINLNLPTNISENVQGKIKCIKRFTIQ